MQSIFYGIYGIFKSTKTMGWNPINKHKYAFLRKCVETSKAVTEWLIFWNVSVSKCLFCVEIAQCRNCTVSKWLHPFWTMSLSGQFQHDPATRRQMHSFKISLLNNLYNNLLSLANMLYRPATTVSTCLVLINPHHYRGKRQYLQCQWCLYRPKWPFGSVEQCYFENIKNYKGFFPPITKS